MEQLVPALITCAGCTFAIALISAFVEIVLCRGLGRWKENDPNLREEPLDHDKKGDQHVH